MLWVPTVRLLVPQVAVRLLPLPLSAAALQPLIIPPPSVKLTLPVGLVPVTVAVKVTGVPTGAGVSEVASVVVVAGKPVAATPQASISVMREYEARALVTLMRMRSVVNAVKVTLRLTRLLPLTEPRVTQAEPFQPCTAKCGDAI